MALNKKNKFNKKEITLAEFAKALSHPARIAILNALSGKNYCICGEIVANLPLAQATVSQHLKELKKSGLITGRIDGVKSCYCIDMKKIEELQKVFNNFISETKESFNLCKNNCK